MNYSDSGIECSFIQNLLYNFHTPTIKVLSNIDVINNVPYEGQHYINNQSLYTRLTTKDGTKDVFDSSYEVGKYYRGITRNYVPTSNYYSIELHEALGNYLRFIKDYYNLDLMPLYNCFSNRFIDKFSLPLTDERKKGSVIKQSTKLFAFPVRYGCSYSIFCRNSANALIQPAFYNGKDILVLYDSDKNWIRFDETPLPISQWDESIYTMPTVDELATKEDDKNIYRHNEINLYLFIQIPENNAANIIVIENNSSRVINNTLINNSEQKPFSDKLIGYLLSYFITPQTTIQENIERVQKMLSSCYYYTKDREGNTVGPAMRLGEGMYKDYTQGTFDMTTRQFIYDLYRLRGISDFTGYVDKDVEELIENDYREQKGVT